MEVKTSTLSSGVGLIELQGALLSEDEIGGLRRAVAKFVERRCRKLLIDFQGVSYLNSTALGVLVAAHTTYSKRHWELKFCNINKHVHVVFSITNINKVFTICETREAAIASFAGSTGSTVHGEPGQEQSE